jgi:hypothetical protein
VSNRPEATDLERGPSAIPSPPRAAWIEGFGCVLLAALAVFFIATSWRKWPDPLIDFGRELYTPWRIAEGAVLYRDVENPYGPLSSWLNGMLFTWFGPGLMVLVAANLAVFAAILTMLYILCRRAWGALSAWVASVVFVVVFGFSQFGDVGNYNYATPYAHATTHGILVCLLLVAAVVRWMEKPSAAIALGAGFLFGLTMVLKPEIMIAAGAVVFAAGILRWWRRQKPTLTELACLAVGAALPTLAFTVYFSARLPWTEALSSACRGWLNLATASLTHEHTQTQFLGFDEPGKHLLEHFQATVMAVALIVLMAWIARRVERSDRAATRWALGGMLVFGLAGLAAYGIHWIAVGRCLLGLIGSYIVITAASLFRSRRENVNPILALRWLLGVLAAALMLRMTLHGRIYHYGYYQAALAGVLVPALLVGELPERLRLRGAGRCIVLLAAAALIVPGLVILTARSQRELGLKTYAVGSGRDRFYTRPPDLDRTGELVQRISSELRKPSDVPELIVLPEGVMINYLARCASPVRTVSYYGAFTMDGLEAGIVKQLQSHPPGWVVVVSRDLREFGIERYGEPGNGRELLEWMHRDYQPIAALGDDPLDPRKRGALVLKRKSTDPTH